MPNTGKRLVIGPGHQSREGWMSVDADPARGADFLATIPPFPAAVKAIVWDEIEWIHGITSLYPWEAAIVLREAHDILAPGGKLVLEQPDFLKARERVEWLFGDPGFRNPLHMNRWSYSQDSLCDLLRESGFSLMTILPAQYHKLERDFRVEAYA